MDPSEGDVVEREGVEELDPARELRLFNPIETAPVLLGKEELEKAFGGSLMPMLNAWREKYQHHTTDLEIRWDAPPDPFEERMRAAMTRYKCVTGQPVTWIDAAPEVAELLPPTLRAPTSSEAAKARAREAAEGSCLACEAERDGDQCQDPHTCTTRSARCERNRRKRERRKAR